jgi:predicted esterase
MSPTNTKAPRRPVLTHRFLPSGGSPVTLLLLHGTGGNENDLIPLGQRLLPGAAILSPRGAVLENGMPRFFRRLAEGVFDINDLIARTDELSEFVSTSSKTYGFAPDKVVAVGYSNGANIAVSVLLLHPGTLAGAVLFRPMMPFAVQKVPDLSAVKVLIESGTDDNIVPIRQPEELAEALKRGDAEVTLRWERGGGHSLTEDEIRVAGEWIRERFNTG